MAECRSPVDIPPSAPVHRDGLQLRHGTIPLVLGQNPAAVQVHLTCDAGAVIDETPYELLQLHLHCPSEHTFDGTDAPMALHLVHRAADRCLAVVAVMSEEGPPNPAMAAPVSALGQADAPAEIDLASLLPADRACVACGNDRPLQPLNERGFL